MRGGGAGFFVVVCEVSEVRGEIASCNTYHVRARLRKTRCFFEKEGEGLLCLETRLKWFLGGSDPLLRFSNCHIEKKRTTVLQEPVQRNREQKKRGWRASDLEDSRNQRDI